MIFHILLAFQILMTFVALTDTLILSRQRSSVDHKFLMITTFTADAYMFGYLVEMTAKSKEVAIAAYSFEYMGLAYLALCYTIFMLSYCRVKINAWIWRCIFFFDTFILFCVVFSNYIHWYYSDTEFVNDGVFPHLVTGKTLLYWIFAVYQALCMIVSAIVLGFRMKKVERLSEKRRIRALLIESLIPIAGMVATTTGSFGGYDPSPAVLVIMITLMTVTLTSGKMFDIVNVALENVFEKMPTGFIVLDLDNNFVESNEAAELIFPELKTYDSGAELSALGIDLTEEDAYFEKDGRFYSLMRSSLYEKKHHVGYIVNINDVTAMREQMEEMRELKEDADAANEAKSNFLANMSHEIRTPLNAIIGMANLSETETDDNVKADYNRQIKSAGEMLLGIVSDVLDFSKAESGKLELVPVEYDIREFLNGIINVANMRIGDKPVDFIVDINPNIPKELYGDEIRIRQIVMNLLGNAEKFTNEGSITFTLDFVREGHGVIIKGSVQDTGIGVRKEDLPKLFSAFQQVDTKRNRKIAGSGLGLSIFAQLVTSMGGHYNVESEYGKGTKFSFDIPQDIADDKPFAPGFEREKIKVEKLTSFFLYDKEHRSENDKIGTIDNEVLTFEDARVLVVDDNRVNVKVLLAYLRHYHINADAANSGKEALRMVEEKEYDLIFMDHMMPEMDGVETAEHMREMDMEWIHCVPIVACTANVVKGVEELFSQGGMNDFIPKPIQMATLQATLIKYLMK